MIAKAVGIIILLAVTAFLLRGFGWQGAAVFAATSCTLLLSEALVPLSHIFSSVKAIGSTSNITEPLGAAIKVLGIGYLFGMCADVCRDLGEGGIAKAAEAVGRVEIIAVVLPYFEEIIRLGVEFVG